MKSEIDTFRLNGAGLIVIAIGILVIPVSAAMDFTPLPNEPLFSSPYHYSFLTHIGESCDSPRWSPDGNEIAFICRKWAEPCNCTSAWQGDVEGPAQLYIMNSDGSDRRMVSNLTVLSGPSWNPQGTHLLILGGEYTGSVQNPKDLGYWLIAKNGSGQQLLLNESIRSYSWSPDGSNIAYFTNDKSMYYGNSEDGISYYQENVYVLKIFNLNTLQSRELYRIPNSPPIIQPIKWTENSKKIVILSQENWTSSGQYLLVKINTETGEIEKTPVVTNSNYWISTVAWNPHLNVFAYLTNSSYNNTNMIRLVDPVHGADSPLTEEGYYALLLWNPDGTCLGYSDQGDIWAIDSNGNDRIQYTMNGSIRSFSWHPEGTRIVFNEPVKVTDCEPQLGYFGIGWPQREKIWQNWTTASFIGILDLDRPIQSSTSSPGFDILTVMCATGAAVLLARKRR